MLQALIRNGEPISMSFDRLFPVQDNRHHLPFGRMSLRSPFREGIRNIHSLVKWSELHRRGSRKQCFDWSKVQMIQKIQFPARVQPPGRKIQPAARRSPPSIGPLPIGNNPPVIQRLCAGQPLAVGTFPPNRLRTQPGINDSRTKKTAATPKYQRDLPRFPVLTDPAAKLNAMVAGNIAGKVTRT